MKKTIKFLACLSMVCLTATLPLLASCSCTSCTATNNTEQSVNPTLTLAISADGAGTVNGGGTYDKGTAIAISATANNGYRFVAWKNAQGVTVTQTATHTVTVNEDVVLIAYFEKIDGDSEIGGNTGYTRVDVDGNADEKGEYVLFGQYPQSEVTDETLKTSLTGKMTTDWTAYDYYVSGETTALGYMWYQDITHENARYRAVYFTDYRPSSTLTESGEAHSYQDENGYDTGIVYWFKFEPIQWRILTIENGNATLLSNDILDSQSYHFTGNASTVGETTVYSNNYAQSALRAWLNEDFYQTAFTSAQTAIIQTTTVENGLDTTGNNANEFVCENTQDKIYLLSYADTINVLYGFNSDGVSADTYRQKQSTAYAKAQGNKDNTWWLRTPHETLNNATRYVATGGQVYYSTQVYETVYGVVPTIQIAL